MNGPILASLDPDLQYFTSDIFDTYAHARAKATDFALENDSEAAAGVEIEGIYVNNSIFDQEIAEVHQLLAAPTITCPGNITRDTGAGLCTFTVSGTVLDPTNFTTDHGAVPTNDFNSLTSLDGATFPLGTTTITWTITDVEGTATCTVSITVEDNEAPQITTCPPAITVATDTGSCSATGVTLGSPVATDNCTVAGDLVVSNDAPASFPIGNTTVTWTVTDAAGNPTTCQQIVTVEDNEAPQITTCPPAITVATDTGSCSATGVTLGSPVATDNCTVAGDLVVSNDAPASFPIGNTTVTWTVTDAAGNATTCQQIVTVEDNEAPQITTCPPAITVATDTGSCSATGVTLGSPVATDNCTVAGSLVITNDAPASFPVGATTVTWTVTDAAGNATTCQQIVTVEDNEAPQITSCPPAITVATDTGSCSATGVTLGSPVATDNCTVAGDLVVSNDAPASFPIGNTTVTWTVTDAAGNATTCQQIVTVEDNEAPQITSCPPAITVATDTGSCSATGVTLGSPVATDNCTVAGDLVVSNDAPASFPIGNTTVTWTVTDAAGNATTCQQIVTVEDNEPPTFTCPTNRSVNLNASCELVVPNLLSPQPAWTDNCAGGVTFTQNPAAGTALASSHGQTHIVTITATDAAGNPATCEVTLTGNDVSEPTITCPTPPAGGFRRNMDFDDCFYTVQGTEFDPASFAANCPDYTVTYRINGGAAVESASLAGVTLPTGSNSVAWTITGANGRTATCTIQIVVVDERPPIITFCPPDITVATPDLIPEPDTTLVIAHDNCGPVSVVHWEDEYVGIGEVAGFCPEQIIRTYRVYDDAGNYTDCFQIIDVTDTDDCSTCQSNVPHYWVDFYDEDCGATFTTDYIRREGQCCEQTSPDRCISFSVRVGPNAVGFFITNDEGANPPGWYYQVDCGPQEPMGSVYCAPPGVYHTVTICKAGSNRNTYTVHSVCGIITAPDIDARVECDTEIEIAGVVPETVEWFHPNPAYLDYLSPASGSLTTTFHPDENAPSYIEYEVCGVPVDGANPCVDPSGRICTTVRVNVYPEIQITLDYEGVVFCEDDPGDIVASIQPTTNVYDIEWYNPTGDLIHTGPVLPAGVVQANGSGTYTIRAIDVTSGLPCNEADLEFEIIYLECMECPTQEHCFVEDIVEYNTVSEFIAAGGVVDFPCNVPETNIFLADQYSDGNNCPETIIQVYEIWDACGNTAWCEVVITIGDTIPPVATAPPDMTNLEACDPDDFLLFTDLPFSSVPTLISLAQFQAEGGTASDNCGIETIHYEDVILGECPMILTRTFTITDRCGNFVVVVQEFSYLPFPLDVPVLENATVNACDFDNVSRDVVQAQVDLDAAIAAWVADQIAFLEINVGGGCDFEVTACDFADQAAVDARFNTWLSEVLTEASVAGGCDPQVSNNAATVTIPSLCSGGTVTVTWTVDDLCENPTFEASFTLTPPPAVTFTQPGNLTVDACDFADQAAVDARFNTWLSEVLTEASVAGGCDPQVSNNAATVTIPSLCSGGTVTVTWTVDDLCENPTFEASFTLTPPPAVTFTQPGNLTVDACDFADQAAVDARFNTWLSEVLTEASVAGGCDPQVSNNAATVTIPSLCSGGTVTVTWTVDDLCENPTFEASFTLTPPPAVTFTQPGNLTVDACDFADQAAVDARFNTWLSEVLTEASVAGGCDPQVSNNAATVTIPSLCSGGTVTVTWTVDDLCENPTFEASFTLTPPPAVTFTQPGNLTVDACDFADQAAVDARFNTWLSEVLTEASVAGGCDPQVSNNAATVTIPSLCSGGTVTVTWTVDDLCENPTFEASFTLTPPPAVTFTQPGNLTVDACDFADQAAVDARFNTWLSEVLTEASVAGGCDPQVSNNAATVTIPSLCSGGTVTVTWTVDDLCENPTFEASFTLTPPPAVTFTQPGNLTVDACDFADQAAVDARFNTWLSEVLTEASVAGGCDPQVSNNAATVTIPSLCSGGTVTVTWTVDDLCENPTFEASFTLTPPPAVTFTQPGNLTVDACDFADQAAVDARFNTWLSEVLTEASVAGGCDPQVSNNAATVTIPSLCSGGTVTVTWTVDDLCENPTFEASFTLTPPPAVTFTQPGNLTVDACDFADQAAVDARFNTWLSEVLTEASVAGGCDPQVSNNAATVTIPSLCSGGTVTVTWTVDDLCENPTFEASFTLTPPPAVTFTQPGNLTVDACDFADQAAVDARFNTWLSEVLTEASVAGGCDPQVSNNAATVTIPSLCSGGTVTVTWTVDDLCENPTFEASFTLTPPPAVTFTQPGNLTVDACDFADQAAVDARFNTWLSEVLTEASVAGGCDPQVSNNAATVTIPSLCSGGTVTVTWTVDDLCENPTFEASFTLTPPPAVTFTQPGNLTVDACDFADQAAVDARFNTWLSEVLTEASVAGGCDPQVSNNAATVTIPSLCSGGTVTVTWTVDDLCENPTFEASFTLTPPPAVTFTQPGNLTVDACDFADQAAVDARFNTWLSEVLTEASVAGGCDPQVSNNAATVTIPSLCSGGTVTVTWTVDDLCENPTFEASFTLTPPPAVTFTQPGNLTVDACDFADQAAVDARFNTWLSEVLTEASVAGGCDPQVSNNAATVTIPSLCSGGTVTVTWTVDDLCENPTFEASFTLTPPPAVTFTQPGNLTVDACDFADQAAVDARFNTWLSEVLTEASVAGGCDPQVSNNAATVTIPSLCSGGTVTVTWTVDDLCENPTFEASFTLTPPPAVTFTQPGNLTVDACDFADQAAVDARFNTWLSEVLTEASVAGGCDPQVSNNAATVTIPSLCSGGTVTVTWTVDDLCENPTFEASFTLTPPPAVTFTQPGNLTVDACDFADQAAVDARFNTWLSEVLTEASVAGGCDPQVSNNAATVTIPSLCSGGTVTVTWTVDDLCENPTFEASFTLTPPPAVTFTQPGNLTVDACDFADQAAVDARFNTWLSEVLTEASVAGGCDPQVSNNAATVTIPSLCSGGTVTVTWTVDDLCENPTFEASFTLTPPPAVTFTQPGNLTVDACDFADQAAVDARFNTWLSEVLTEASVAGGCDPQVSNNAATVTIPSLCSGGTVTVTWTVDDLCENPTFEASFTLTPPPAVTFTQPGNLTVDACDFADQAAVDARFNTWLSEVLTEASVAGGCDPQVSNNAATVTIPSLCSGGTVTVTWTVDDLCENPTFEASFTLTPPPAVTFTQPGNLTVDACDFADQAAVDARFNTWLSEVLTEASVAGGCDPQVSNNAATVTIPSLCSGGTVTVTWTVDDLCENPTFEASFTLTPPPAVTFTQPGNLTVDACDFADQAAVDARFNTWLSEVLTEASVAGGCDPQVSNNAATVTIPSLCSGGTVTVTWTVDDLCENPTFEASFTLTPPPAVTFTQPGNLTVDACDFADQAAVDARFNTWLSEVLTEASVAGGCDPQVSNNAATVTIPSLCSGGTVTVTWTVDDLCENPTFEASFTLTPPPAVTFTQPGNLTVDACDFADQAAVDARFNTWLSEVLTEASVAGGCDPQVSNNAATVTIPSLCSGGTVTVTWTVDDLCENPTFEASFTLTPPPAVTFTQPGNLTVDACDFADQAAVDARFNTWLSEVLTEASVAGGCDPQVSNNAATVTIPSLCSGGTVTVTWTVDDLCENPTFEASFTLTPPPAVTFTQPGNLTVDACDFADQAAVDARFNTWLSEVLTEASVAGGCDPQVSNNAATVTIPSLCSGGTVTVTWTVDDLCENPTFEASFTLTPPPAVTFTQPGNLTVDACDFADQAAVDARFNTWLSEVLTEASVAGGCDPQVSNNAATVTIPSLCSGGTVTVTWTVDDLCENPTFEASFTLTPPPAVTFTQPGNLTVDACDFADQAAVDARFNTWLSEVLTEASVAGGCDPQVSNNAATVTIPSLCSGGTVTVTWTVDDLCENPTFEASFTLTPPPAVTFTQPGNLTVDACDFADQAAVDARFNTWLSEVLTEASVAGGCDPQVSNNAATVTIPSLCSGGTVTVTWTVDDLCENPTFEASFTLTPPPAVTFTQPGNLTVDACDFADQAAVDARFNTWLSEVLTEASVAGGCDPQVSNNAATVTIPSLCSGGTVTVTWTVDDLCENPTFEASFTLTPPPAVTFTQPGNLTVDACDFADQAAVDARFNTWLSEVLTEASVAGGCDPQVSNNAATVTIPSLCSGGTVTVTWTVDDLCENPTFEASFTLTPPPAVTFTQPGNLTVDACDFADQAAVDARFNTWLSEVLTEASVAGGCDPQVSNNAATVTIPSLCSGGTVTVTWTVDDLCENPTFEASFTLTPPPAVTFTQPGNLTVDACDFADQAAVDARFNTWLSEVLTEASVAGGCDPQVSNNAATVTIPSLCSGGTVTVTWTVDDLCENPTFEASFTLTPPPAVTFTQPGNLTVDACDFADQAAVDARFNTWLSEVLTEASVAGGCDPQVSNNAATVTIPSLCSGGTVTVTWTVDDLCENPTFEASFTLTPPPAVTFTQPGNLTVDACDFADQTAVNQAISDWVSNQTTILTNSLAGGCDPQVDHDFDAQTIDICEDGSITITWTITDTCQAIDLEATLNFTAPETITYTAPVGKDLNACDFADQTDMNQAISDWVSNQTTILTNSLAGGCDPQVDHDFDAQTIDICEDGSITITWTITDLCQTSTWRPP
jgi:hypothetical protein